AVQARLGEHGPAEVHVRGRLRHRGELPLPLGDERLALGRCLPHRAPQVGDLLVEHGVLEAAKLADDLGGGVGGPEPRGPGPGPAAISSCARPGRRASVASASRFSASEKLPYSARMAAGVLGSSNAAKPRRAALRKFLSLTAAWSSGTVSASRASTRAVSAASR